MIFEEFQEFRKILCVCPCCRGLVRVSDLHLRTKEPVTKTWLDNFDNDMRLIEKKEERFEEREAKLREIAVQKGRKAAQKIFNKAITPAFKALKLNPYDVKPILHPVDFIVFNGMEKKGVVNDVVFLSKVANNVLLNNLRNQVKKVIEKKEYDWQLARIDEKGSIVFE